MAIRLMPRLFIIILMILLRRPEAPCLLHRGHYRVPFRLQLLYQFPGNSPLLIILVKNGRTILGSPVWPLTVQLGRIMNLKKQLCKCFIADLFRIEHHLHRFSMSGFSTADIPVRGVLKRAAGIT